MKAYKSVYNNLNNSKKSKNSSRTYNDESFGFYTSDQDIKNKREELIRKYSNSSKNNS